MAKVLFTDNATTELAASVSSGATTCSVVSGSGALFPNPNTELDQYFYATFVSASNPNTKEIVTVSARSTDTMTISATTTSWNAGDTFALLQPAEALEAMTQFDDLQAQLGNYALDVGSANAYSVTLTPALGTHIDGAPIRWRAAHTNTGASTFNDGTGSAALVLPGNVALVAGTITAGWTYTTFWSAENSCFELAAGVTTFAQLAGTASASQVPALSGLSGQVTSAQVPEAAVTQYSGDILASAALTGTPTTPTAAAGTDTTQVASTAFVQTAVNPGASLGTPGYQKLQSGLVLQWGSATSNGSTQTVSFATAMPNGVLTVLVAPSVSGYTAAVTAWSTTGFTMSSTAAGSQTIYWLAVGH